MHPLTWLADVGLHASLLADALAIGCHGHHGQLPAAEYLVATAAHTDTDYDDSFTLTRAHADEHAPASGGHADVGVSGAAATDAAGPAPKQGPQFLPWHNFMALCLRHGLPLNDLWIIAGR